MSGNVAYSRGAPIEGATVQLGSVSATTDVQGNFAFRNVSHGTYDLTVSVNGEGVYEQRVTVSRTPVTVTVKVDDPVPDPELQLGTVRGQVRREKGTPISGAEVSLGEWKSTTDSNGYYEFTDVEYGSYTPIPYVLKSMASPIQTPPN